MRKLLVLNFFPALTPPASGGEMRYFNLYSRLAKGFDVTLLSPGFPNQQREIVVHSPTFREHRIPKAPVHDSLHHKLATEGITEECSALVCSLAARVPNLFHDAYLELCGDADAIVHECPHMLDYDLLLGFDDKPRVYNSYNIETHLTASTFRGQRAAPYVEHVAELEERLVRASELCFAVSDDDASTLVASLGASPERVVLVPNGIVPEDFPATRVPRRHPRKSVLFFGSFHPPNLEAARFIIDRLAMQCPELDFVIAGSCIAANPPGLPANVKVLGRVDDATRRALFGDADIAINPMMGGGGTNLKSLEFLAAELPLLATPLGVRGLRVENDVHARIVEASSFSAALSEFARDQETCARIARAGRERVLQHYSWDAIAAAAGDRLESMLAAWKPDHRRTFLVLNDFPCATPTSGGEVRIHRLYRALAQECRVAVVCLTGNQFVGREEIAERMTEFQIPKTAAHRRVERDVDQGWETSARDVVSYLQAPANSLLVKLAAALQRISDAVVLVHPYMIGVVRSLTGRPVVYESLNVETELKRALLVGHPEHRAMATAAEQCEREAIRAADALIAVSKEDQAGLIALGADGGRIFVVPNGVDVPERRSESEQMQSIRAIFGRRPLCVFVGSAHPPNVAAARHICTSLAPAMPDCLFAVVGSVCQAMRSPIPPNVLLLGTLHESEKDIVIELADVALNPMLSGSGSNLKLAEYFAKSRASVTTPFGGRGYNLQNGVDAIVCDLEMFPQAIRALIDDTTRRVAIGNAAWRHAREKLDWPLQAARLRNIVERQVLGRTRPRLLVITYRYTDPPLGGAEVHLLELLRQLDRRGSFTIDVATLDIVAIHNRFHFSCRYTRDANALMPRGLAAVDVRRFPVDEIDDASALVAGRTLFAAWAQELRQISLRHLHLYDKPILLGGWYYPERTGDGLEVWASGEAWVFVGSAERIVVRGISFRRRHLRIRSANAALMDAVVDGQFELEVATTDHDAIAFEMETIDVPDDPRPLGFRLRSIDLHFGDRVEKLALGIDFRSLLRIRHPQQWIDELIATARARDPKHDELFQRARGPNSAALEHWLAGNIAQYDVVVGHSVPFRTCVVAAHHARAAGVPLVQIPDFHVDDEFYHWCSYYDALAAATANITFPRAATALFYERIGARSVYLPHGVDPEEQPDSAGRAAFEQLHSSERPYVLVLGRKDRAKNYEAIVDAVASINARSRSVDVVMIGRDEDGVRLDPADVTYIGPQPRSVVLAAIAGALCVVSMSDSESFGIVILEAWAQRTPVIVSAACHAYTELVEDGVDGLHASPETLAEKIRFLDANPEIAKAMGERGRAKALQRYSWGSIAERLDALLLECATRSPSHLRRSAA